MTRAERVKLKQTAFRLSDRDLEILDEAKRREGYPTRTEAFRFVLRRWWESVDRAPLGLPPKPQGPDVRWLKEGQVPEKP